MNFYGSGLNVQSQYLRPLWELLLQAKKSLKFKTLFVGSLMSALKYMER